LDQTDPLFATQNLKPKTYNFQLRTYNPIGHGRFTAAVPLTGAGSPEVYRGCRIS